MKRSFLTALGLEKAIIDQIMEEHGTSIETLKERNAETMDALKQQVTDLKGQLADKSGGDDFKAQYEAEKEAHKATKAALDAKTNELTAKESEAAKATLLDAAEKQLIADGANPKLTKLLLKEVDVDSIKTGEDGKISNWDAVSQSVKANYADAFGVTRTEGAPAANPPANNPTSYSIEDVKKMTPEQINQNWDAVSKTLEKGV